MRPDARWPIRKRNPREASTRRARSSPTTPLVEDSTWDMLASRTAGSFGIGVLRGGYSHAELSASALSGSVGTWLSSSSTSKRLASNRHRCFTGQGHTEAENFARTIRMAWRTPRASYVPLAVNGSPRPSRDSVRCGPRPNRRPERTSSCESSTTLCQRMGSRVRSRPKRSKA